MIELRLLNETDIPLVESWLNKEHVKKWYEIPFQNIAIDDWMNEIKACNGEYSWITYLIATWEDRPIGLGQYYYCQNSIGENFGTVPIPGTYGIDYLIGEEAFLGKGFGKKIVELLVNLIFSFTDAKRVTADVDENNLISKKTLLSAGFTLWDIECNRFVIQKLEK